MKFLCVGCDEAMALAQAPAPPSEGSLTAVFHCAHCGHRVALLANAWETQLVCSLGVAIGGREPSRQPLALVRATLAEARLLWTEQAEQRLARVPEAVRPMARAAIERYARECGYGEVDCAVMDEAKARMRG
jgi:citrate synthase